MNGTFKNLTLTAVLVSFAVSAYASGVPQAEGAQASPFIQQALDQAANPATREAAVDDLLANIEAYQAEAASPNKGPYENNLKARLKAIDSIWALGEIGDPRLMGKLTKFYTESDDVLKMNLIISMGKLKNNQRKAGPFLFDVAADARETEVVRALAFEVLDLIGHPSTVINLQRSATGIEKADLIYTGGITGTISGWFSPDLPIGHAGLFVGTEVKNGKINVVIADCVPDNFKPGGVRNIYSWYNFTHHFMYPYYGHRTTSPKPTAAQRDRIAKLGLEYGAKGLHYSDTHFSQKGPKDFDCVGYTEFLYEAVGLNPTEDSYETGMGWPLTPWEQFISVKPPLKPQGTVIVPNYNIVTPNQAAISQGFSALTGAFGMGSLRAQEVSGAIQPELVD